MRPIHYHATETYLDEMDESRRTIQLRESLQDRFHWRVMNIRISLVILYMHATSYCDVLLQAVGDKGPIFPMQMVLEAAAEL
jgi:hypothetical protein